MKKRLTRVLSCALALLFVVMPLSSCAGSSPLKIVKDGESAYRIVYENGNREAGNAAEYLAAELEELTEVELEVTDDRTEADKKIPEILVGRTNRGTDYQLQRTLRYGSYTIAREKKNVYILGAGDGMLTQACEDFLTDVLDESYKVRGKGVLLTAEGSYAVSTVTLNGRAITDYTVYLPEHSKLNWDQYLGYVEDQLAAVSGFMLTTVTYTDVAEVSGPAIVLQSDDSLGSGEYKIKAQGQDTLYLSADSQEAVMAMAMAFITRLSDKKAEAMELKLEDGGGRAGENPLMPMTEGTDLRVMTFNIYATPDHKSLMPFVSASMYAYAPDFVCLQECSTKSVFDVVGDDMAQAGYGIAGATFTEVSPTALENAATDDHYQRFAHLGANSCTPILYRTDRWESVEQGSYLFYWKNRYHMTNTKSLSYGVFKNKTTQELVLIISTHFPLMTSSYVGKGDAYMMYSGTDNVLGAAWRNGATQEILKEVDAMRAKYPGILTVVGGDMNAKSTEDSMKTMENHAVLSDAIVMAPDGMISSGASYHDYGKAPSATVLPIDHLFVSEDVASVLRHLIVADPLTVQGSDHCPVIVDIARK